MSICGCGYRVLYTEHPIESAQIKLTESEWVKVFRVENGGLRNFHVDTNAIRLESHCFRCGVYESRSSQAISSYIFQYGAMPCTSLLFFLFLPLISSFSVSRFESASFDCSYCNKDRDGDTSYFFFYLFVFMPTWWHVHIEAHETMQTHRMQIPAPICYIMFILLYNLYCCCGHRPNTTRLNQMNKNIKGTNRMRLLIESFS